MSAHFLSSSWSTFGPHGEPSISGFVFETRRRHSQQKSSRLMKQFVRCGYRSNVCGWVIARRNSEAMVGSQNEYKWRCGANGGLSYHVCPARCRNGASFIIQRRTRISCYRQDPGNRPRRCCSPGHREGLERTRRKRRSLALLHGAVRPAASCHT